MEIELSQGKVALVDACDFGRLSQHKWTAKKCVDMWYAVRQLPREAKPGSRKRTKPREVYLHREVLSARSGQWVRNTSGDGLDCRRENLELRTHGETLGYAKGV